jgi:hypothetical protein
MHTLGRESVIARFYCACLCLCASALEVEIEGVSEVTSYSDTAI